MNLTPRINRLEPNVIIDGGMEIWPEGTSRSVANNTSLYGSVLFKAQNTATGISLTNSQQASVPANTNLTASNQISKTAAGTLAAGTFVLNTYFVEGYDVSKLMRNEFSLIFWVKSSVASSRSVSLGNASQTHTLVKQYAISQANTWELKVLKYDPLNTCPGTINRGSGVGLQVNFSVVVGSTFQTATLNSWQAGTFLSGIGEDSTWLTGTNHDFSIAGVMILPGDWTVLTASNYDFIRSGRSFQDELMMTQRYYEKSYDLNTAPLTAADDGSLRFNLASVSPSWNQPVIYKVNKRVQPTFRAYTPLGVDDRVRDESAAVDRTYSVQKNGQTSASIQIVGGTTGNIASFHWTAEARF